MIRRLDLDDFVDSWRPRPNSLVSTPLAGPFYTNLLLVGHRVSPQASPRADQFSACTGCFQQISTTSPPRQH
ncbi:hypothetical protein CJ030_MR7G011384 [Morella rubra]|uniref:Uncharacterized protein n=1 Tax=Morella rubra TaxID=262757 RepID=A0A6A1V343_9ROSI|nr:hypothetical protein CJ030_MR7G011384 [Morella rubra]